MLILTVCCVLCRVFYFENLLDALCIVAASVKNSVHILGWVERRRAWWNHKRCLEQPLKSLAAVS